MIKKTGAFNEDILLKLNEVFGQTLVSALELLDKGNVTEITSDGSGRKMYQVKGTSGICYLIFPDIWRCSCPGWLHNTLINDESITCKHILASKLVEAFDKAKVNNPYVKQENIREETFVQMVANMD